MIMIRNKLFQILSAFLLLWFAACTGNFDEINRNPNEVTAGELSRGGYNIGAALIGVQNYVIPTGLYLHQFMEMLAGGAYSGYFGSTPQWSAKFATYDTPTDWNRAPFNDVIGGFYPNYDLLRAVTTDEIPLAIGDICRVAAMHRVTDMYGPIPYSKMRAAGDGGSVDENGTFEGDLLAAPYDSQKDVYTNMLADLNSAINALTANINTDASYLAKYDRVYGGNIENWVRFANSLKLRIAIRMYYADEPLAKQTAEEAVSHTIGVITANAQNAALTVDQNPMYTQVIEWEDERAGADILSYMNGYNDPRREKYFAFSTFPGHTTDYIGMRSGITVVNKSEVVPCSAPVVDVKAPIQWMTAAEVAFLKAEGALHSWNMGSSDVETFYKQGITLSFEQWGVSNVSNYLDDDASHPVAYTAPVTTYGTRADFNAQSGITIKWDNAATTEQKLERIITQKWIAIYPLGVEAWSEFRRTGYPRLAPVVDNKSGGIIPAGQFIKRLTFTDYEYQRNAANVMEAIGLLGGPDNQGTKLWWDKKN
jgi:hypothetical protein